MMTEDLLESYKNILSSNNYKLTSQRNYILKVLIKNPNRHFSADELYEEVKKINPDVGLATIYRNLELFCRLGIAHRLDFDNEYKCYELSIKGNHHHHLICVKCGKIIEFNDRVIEDFEQEIKSFYDFKITDHTIKFYGICNECREK